MKNSILILVALLIALIGGYYFFNNPSVKKEDKSIIDTTPFPSPIININKQAKYLIFTNKLKRNFSAVKYHHQSEEVFIQSDEPSIIYIKKNKITWDDFFQTLPMKLTNSCLTTGDGETLCTNNSSSLKFYLNGIEVENLLEFEIQNEDKLLISYGDNSKETIENQLQQLNEI